MAMHPETKRARQDLKEMGINWKDADIRTHKSPYNTHVAIGIDADQDLQAELAPKFIALGYKVYHLSSILQADRITTPDSSRV